LRPVALLNARTNTAGALAVIPAVPIAGTRRIVRAHRAAGGPLPVSRRRFVHALGAGSLGALLAPGAAARGLEARRGGEREAAPPGALVRLDSNENPNGPGRAALDAMAAALAGSHRYADDAVDALRTAVARAHGVERANVWVGAGSTDLLRAAVYAWTSPARPLVTAAPSFETPVAEAARTGAPVRAVPVHGDDLRLDLAAMAAAARDAGLVYVCNPNNPTATVHGRDAVADFVGRLRREAPGCVALVDEAYHEYVDDPRYASAVPLALEDPRVVVARTFSKVHGLAGARAGYAVGHADAIARLAPYVLDLGVSGAAAAGAAASLAAAAHVERERAANRAAREFTRRFFVDAGFAPAASEANFLMVDLRRDVRAFREACRADGVLIGRLFPPLARHARVTVGTMDEMRRATEVFRRVLAAS
jgi:histidinol-phosphate aminotransferase